jgi:hypothetical protein
MRRRAVAATVLAFLTAGVATVAAPQPAMAAERHGCTGVGPKVDIRGIGVSNGESCVFVVGSGLRIDRAYAAFFTSVKPICNWWVDIDTPAEDERLRHFQGAFHNGCTKWSGTIHAPIPRSIRSKPGRVCATLFSDAIVRARSCLSIHT